MTLARKGLYEPSLFAALMLFCAVAILLQQGPEISYERKKAPPSPEVVEMILLLLLITVLVRALVGMTVDSAVPGEVMTRILDAIGADFGRAVDLEDLRTV